MALEGLGIAWVPQLSVRAELARGELVVCGGPQWHVPLEIRLYRCALVGRRRTPEPNLGPNAGQMWKGGLPPIAVGQPSMHLLTRPHRGASPLPHRIVVIPRKYRQLTKIPALANQRIRVMQFTGALGGLTHLRGAGTAAGDLVRVVTTEQTT
eukprot:gene3592-5124_t